ncbi:MAG: late competence protein ComER [Bacillales bacterium]|nr:late competence protein ComER [Bacillales bacterium]
MIVGIIGTGTMGTILIDAFIASEALRAEQLIITNRSLQKARVIANKHKRIKVASENIEVIRKANLLFICVKPKELFHVFQEMQSIIKPEQCVVTITSPLSETQLDYLVKCSTARIIPSITNRALSGVSLFTFGKSCTNEWRKKLYQLFEKVSTPIEIDKSNTRIAADITSCGPAFISFLLQKFIQAAVDVGGMNEVQTMKLTEEMIIGFAELLKKNHYNLVTLQNKVCVKGGITGEGIRVLENGVGTMFEEMFKATNAKFVEDVQFLETQIGKEF